jgi:hypothetical protein
MQEYNRKTQLQTDLSGDLGAYGKKTVKLILSYNFISMKMWIGLFNWP